MQRKGFWTCLVDGVLWLMLTTPAGKEYKLCPMASTVEEFEKALAESKEKERG